MELWNVISPAGPELHRNCTVADLTSQHTCVHNSVPSQPTGVLGLAVQSDEAVLLAQLLMLMILMLLLRQLKDRHLHKKYLSHTTIYTVSKNDQLSSNI